MNLTTLTDILDWIKNPEHKEQFVSFRVCDQTLRKASSKGLNSKLATMSSLVEPHGRKRPGVVIVTLNPAKAVIKDTNLGGKWRVPYSMMEAA